MNFPIAKKKDHHFNEHGIKRNDLYYWMRNKEDKAVIDYLNKENDYTQSYLKDTENIQKQLFLEMKARIKEDDSSVPYFSNGFWYYTRFDEGSEYAIYCRKEGRLDSKEEVLLDENEMAADHSFYEIVSFSISPNNSIIAYSEDVTGRRQYQIKFKDLSTGKLFPETINHAGSDLAWESDDAIYYALKEKETLRPNVIKRHVLNTPEDNDELIFEEKDEAFITGVSKDKNNRFIYIGSWSTLSTEYKVLDLSSQNKEFNIVLPRTKDLEYYPESTEDGFFIKHNYKAPNFKISFAKFDAKSMNDWEDFQIHDEAILLEDFEVFKGYLVVQEKINGLSRLKVYNLEKNKFDIIPPKEETFMMYLDENPNVDTEFIRIKYSSLTTPTSVIDIDLNTFKETVQKVQTVLGEFESKAYKSERVWANSEDGTKVPMSLVYKKDLFKKDGTNPTLLYGYGSYGVTIDPYFSSVRLSLLDKGFVFVIAHIRGSEYLGRNWYEDGKFLKKENSFKDFIACGTHLISNKYSAVNKLFAMGGSAGGLLMGAVANMAPELWAGIVSNVPFVDVVTTMMDDTIPLTTGEYEEWGNPSDKTYFDYMLTYSPYDNLKAINYPPMLITSGLHDSQVQYWEPTKYVAKLRDLKTDTNPLLLHTNMEAGHGGASGRFESLKEVALEYAFLFKIVGEI